MKSSIIILGLIGICICGLAWQESINPNGYNTMYYPNGKVLSEGNFKNGKPEGYWKTYYTSGILKSEGNRKNHLLDGVWLFYNSIGDTLTKTSYLEGKKNGYHCEYFSRRDGSLISTTLKSKELYVKNLKEGISTYYYENGKVKAEIPYLNGNKEGIGYEYSSNGRVITINRYRNNDIVERQKINRYNEAGEKDGKWLILSNAKKAIREENFKNGKLHGYYKEYDKNGILLVTLLYNNGKLVIDEGNKKGIDEIVEKTDGLGNITKGLIRNGVKVGVHTKISKDGNIINSFIYDNNGNLVSEGLIDSEGFKQGEWKEYYPNSTSKAVGKYSNSKKVGKWMYYYESGVVEQEGNYVNGQEEGLWTWYHDNGEVFVEESYFGGVEDGMYSEYDNYGNLISQGEYIEGEREGEWITIINDFKAVGNYITGLRDGKWKYYYDDGTVLFEGSYIQGLPVGRHKYFYPSGTIREEQFYSNGIPNKHWKKFNELGEVIITITYDRGQEYRINGEKIDLPNEKVLMN